MKKIFAFLLSTAILVACMLPVVAYRVPSAANWADITNSTDGTGDAIDNQDGSVTVSITDSSNTKRMTTSQAYKLDGLYISLINATSTAGAVPFMITPNAGGWTDGAGLLNIAGGNMVYYKEMVDGESTTIRTESTGWSNFITNNPRNSLYMYFYRQADGSFKYKLNGGTFTLTSEEIVRMFGSANPVVYFSIGSSWFEDGKSTSVQIKELSSNTNRLMSYYDQFDRDSFVSTTGDMSGITIEHYNNEGAYNSLARAVKLDGLDFKYINASPELAPGNLWFKYSTAQDGCYNTTNAPGLLYFIDEAGRVERYVDNVGWVEIACFFNGTSYGRPSEITVESRKNETTGAFEITFTGNYTAGTNVIIDTIESNIINEKFGDTDPMNYLNFTASATQTVGIESITYQALPVEDPIIPVTGITLDKTTISLELGETGFITATVEPNNSTNQTVTWSSSDESVVTVVDGVVTSIKVGSATITAKSSNDNIIATCEVTVVDNYVSPTANPTVNPTVSPTVVNSETENPTTGNNSNIIYLFCIFTFSSAVISLTIRKKLKSTN